MKAMKNIIYFLIILGLTTVSCTKMLEVEPAQSISADQAIKD